MCGWRERRIVIWSRGWWRRECCLKGTPHIWVTCDSEGRRTVVVNEDGSLVEPKPPSGVAVLVENRLRIWRYGELEFE